MSDRTPEQDLGGIVRDLRRVLERERAAGNGELLASAAKASLGRAKSAPPVAAGRSSEVISPFQPSIELVSSARTPIESSSPARTSSFAAAAAAANRAPAMAPSFPESAESAVPAVASATAVFDLELPPAHAPLNPVDLFDREKIGLESLRVLEDVAREVRACPLCGLCDTRTKAVPGTGSARSGIVFVGEAPGAEEDRTGEPFVGRAGDLLTKIIKAMDDAKLIPGVPLNRETVYICNVLKCRPPENRNPLPHEVELCSPYLRRQLEALQPRIICCLGKFAAELLVGVKGTIASLRGSVYRYQGAKLIVTYHPAACLRNPNYKRPVWEDMQRLAREYQAT